MFWGRLGFDLCIEADRDVCRECLIFRNQLGKFLNVNHNDAVDALLDEVVAADLLSTETVAVA